MQVYTVHILVVVAMTVVAMRPTSAFVISVGVTVSMVVTMVVVMPESHHTDKVHSKTKTADNEQLTKTFGRCTFPQSLECFKCNLNT